MKHDDEDESETTGTVSFDPQLGEVCLFGSVDSQSAGLVLTALRKLDCHRSKRPISLVLATGGGDEESGWAIYDQLRAGQHNIRIEAYAHCHSIGALILQAGDLRLLSENCRVLLHNGSVAMAGDYRVVQTGAAESKFRTRRYYEAIAERSGQAVKQIQKLCDAETILSAQDCLTLGLADGIIAPHPRRSKRR